MFGSTICIMPQVSLLGINFTLPSISFLSLPFLSLPIPSQKLAKFISSTASNSSRYLHFINLCSLCTLPTLPGINTSSHLISHQRKSKVRSIAMQTKMIYSTLSEPALDILQRKETAPLLNASNKFAMKEIRYVCARANQTSPQVGEASNLPLDVCTPNSKPPPS
ncbi:hypothetical protein BDZ45DRAFT_478316 [Acephala macrosclerotiorum]|nr:hypothetical protein BDZ45DRAFT_478316 [Acephala macrosclerotiorum]